MNSYVNGAFVRAHANVVSQRGMNDRPDWHRRTFYANDISPAYRWNGFRPEQPHRGLDVSNIMSLAAAGILALGLGLVVYKGITGALNVIDRAASQQIDTPKP